MVQKQCDYQFLCVEHVAAWVAASMHTDQPAANFDSTSLSTGDVGKVSRLLV